MFLDSLKNKDKYKNVSCAYLLVRRLEFGASFTFQFLSDWNGITEEHSWVSADVDNGRALWCLEKMIYHEDCAFDGKKIVPRFQPFLFSSGQELNDALRIIKLYETSENDECNDLLAISYYKLHTEFCVITVPSRFLSSEKLVSLNYSSS